MTWELHTLPFVYEFYFVQGTVIPEQVGETSGEALFWPWPTAELYKPTAVKGLLPFSFPLWTFEEPADMHAMWF